MNKQCRGWWFYTTSRSLYRQCIIMLVYLAECNAEGDCYANERLNRYVNLQVAHAPGMHGTFSPSQRVCDPDLHRGPCVTYVPWCMAGSITSDFLGSRWQGKRCRNSRRMRNQPFYVSGKRPIAHERWLELFHEYAKIILLHIQQYSIHKRNEQISVLYATLWDREQVYYVICEIGLLSFKAILLLHASV